MSEPTSNKKIFDAFIEVVKIFAQSYISKLTGIRVWIAKIILKYVIKTLNAIGTRIEQNQLAKQRLDKHDAVVKNPNSTPAEISQADIDFLSGK